MKKQDRITALEIANKHEIIVRKTWWNPFQNVEWCVLNSKFKLTYDQYYYLSHNKFLKPKLETKEGEEVILIISELGKDRLQSFIKTHKSLQPLEP